jgi:hypothetical protein
VFKLLIAGAAVIIVLVVIVFVYALTQPGRFEVRRSARVTWAMDGDVPFAG